MRSISCHRPCGPPYPEIDPSPRTTGYCRPIERAANRPHSRPYDVDRQTLARGMGLESLLSGWVAGVRPRYARRRVSWSLLMTTWSRRWGAGLRLSMQGFGARLQHLAPFLAVHAQRVLPCRVVTHFANQSRRFRVQIVERR